MAANTSLRSSGEGGPQFLHKTAPTFSPLSEPNKRQRVDNTVQNAEMGELPQRPSLVNLSNEAMRKQQETQGCFLFLFFSSCLTHAKGQHLPAPEVRAFDLHPGENARNMEKDWIVGYVCPKEKSTNKQTHTHTHTHIHSHISKIIHAQTQHNTHA